MPKRFMVLGAALLALLVLAKTAAAAEKEATIAVLAFRGTADCLRRWSSSCGRIAARGWRFGR